MNKKIIAKRYAQALLQIAIEKKAIEKFEEDLNLINRLLKEEDFQNIWNSKLLQKAEKQELVSKLFADAVSEEIVYLLELLVDKHREDSLEAICAVYQELANIERNILNVDGYSALEVSEEEVAKIQEKLSKLLDKNIKINMQLDPSILGGVIVKYNDQVLDGSVVSQLQKIKQELTK